VTDVYQGGDGNRSELGQGADVVLQLTETLPTDKCYKVFADNFFTSVPLIEKLQERGMHYFGTVRPNRLPGCVLQNESELKKRGRGSFVHKVEQTRNIVAVRWFDNRSVNLLSTYVGVEPIQQSRRWDKKTKQYIYTDRPEIVHEYNHFMGGIDLLDSLFAKYRYKMKSRRWYLYLFWHTLVIGLVNAWLIALCSVCRKERYSIADDFRLKLLMHSFLSMSAEKEVGHRLKIQQFWQRKRFAGKFGMVLVMTFVRTALHTGQLRQIKEAVAKFV